jgi:hypothetical protein
MAKGYNIGGRNYSFDEFLRALDMLDARKNQYGYTVRNPLEMGAMIENLGGQSFSFDPGSGQFTRNPAMTTEMEGLLEKTYGAGGGFMSLTPPNPWQGKNLKTGEPEMKIGGTRVPVSGGEVQRFLALPPETQKLIANMTPEEYGRLKLMGGATPGVRDEGLMPPMEGPAPGQTMGEWLKTQRKEQKTRHKPAEISAERRAQLKLVGQEGLESILRAMAGRGVSSLEAVNRLGAKGLLEPGKTPFNLGYDPNTGTPWTPGTPWQNIVPPSAPIEPTTPRINPFGPRDTAGWAAYDKAIAAQKTWNAAPDAFSMGGGGYWLSQATSQYSDILKERANQIASERLIPFERAQKLALKQMRAPISGASAGGAMSSTWK